MEYEFTTALASIVICTVLLIFSRLRYNDNKTTRSYRHMVIFTAWSCILNILFAWNCSFPDLLPAWADYLLTTYYLGCVVNSARCFYLYVDAITENFEDKTYPKILCNIMLLFFIACLAANCFLGFLFSYDGNGEYSRGPVYGLTLLVLALYGLAAVVRIVRHKKQVSTGKAISIYIMIGLTTIGSVIQLYFFPHHLISYFFPSVAFIVMLFSIETPDYHKLLDAMAELEKAKDEAEQAKREAERATKAKSDFLASMSHEIRTPINAILGFDEMILRESREKSTRQYAADIRSSSKTLLGIINEILDFSRAESGMMEIIPVNYDLFELIYGVNNMFQLRAKGKGIYFDVNIDPYTPAKLYGDEKRIRQILINILTNAVKYTDVGGARLKIGYSRIEGDRIALTVSVEDTGCGMKEEDIQKMFRPYQRLDELKNNRIEGTGLGMTITKYLLEKMDSGLEVSSVFGQGSVFSFTIEQEVRAWESIGDFAERCRNYSFEEADKVGKFTAPQAHILVVDDTPVNLKVFTALLKHTEIQIDTSESGGDAFRLACSRPYDMIFLDHMMPDIDGIETLEIIQHFPMSLNRQTPSVMLTANAMAGAREGYLDRGFVDYLSKPIDSSLLEELLRRYLPPEYIKPMREGAGQEKTELSDQSGAEAEQEDELPEEGVFAALKNIPEISARDGMMASGGQEIYAQVLEEFCNTAEKYAGMIEQYAGDGDLKNYTIQVHSLKSTARLAGASELSEHAKKLEQCGKDNDRETIERETPKLLEEYRGLTNKLKPCFNNKATGPVIDIAELKECLRLIAEALERFDTDTADSIMGKLGEYSMPEAYEADYAKLKELMAEVARDDILELIGNILQRP